jgi:hypothetical protein
MSAHREKSGLISRQDEPPAEPFYILDDLQKFMVLPERINLLQLRKIM